MAEITKEIQVWKEKKKEIRVLKTESSREKGDLVKVLKEGKDGSEGGFNKEENRRAGTLSNERISLDWGPGKMHFNRFLLLMDVRSIASEKT